MCHSYFRWPRLQRFYQQNESYDWLKEFKTRHMVGQQIRRTVESISKRKCLTLKYYAKKILYFLRQQNILRNLKVFLERPPELQSALEGAVLVDQYCNPLADVTLESTSAQIEEITDKVKKNLRVKNATHPSLRFFFPGDCFVLENLEFQRQVICALNAVLYDQLQYKGNERDYYNPLNSYIHQVLLRRTGIPISLSVLYMTLARTLGVPLEPVNFPNHFLLRWCQNQRRWASDDIYDYVYIDAFGKGKQLAAKECENLIRHQVGADYYSAISTSELLLRMVGNLLNIGKRGEGNEKSYQLLRDSLDLYLTINPDNVQYLLLQARLYFHLGIWPEKCLCIFISVLVILIITVGLIMKHKRSGYNCVIYGWDPKCTMSQEWINTMRVHQLSKGADQPFYNVLVQDGTCRYAAQENLEPHSAPLEIAHPEVGRYFSEFSDTHYIANEELQARYPEDITVFTDERCLICAYFSPDSDETTFWRKQYYG
uniref:F-box protein 21 n=1 Tax=Sinocyclocheilus grahami TaxID=75366 RepID=A0A672N9T1_SINGR